MTLWGADVIESRHIQVDVGGKPMPCYLSRPAGAGTYPAVIVLEGVYGFDEELTRLTDLVASFGFVGLAINYFHRDAPDLKEPFTPEGRARGEAATKTVTKAGAHADVAAARDWLNEQPFVTNGRIATWGFGFGGTMAFTTATLPGLNAAVVFYGQSIASSLPSGEPAPIWDAREIRAPLLLIFGGKDEMIGQRDIGKITETLTADNKRFDVQIYPNVGHSFFRATGTGGAARESADAWDRVQAFLRRNLIT